MMNPMITWKNINAPVFSSVSAVCPRLSIKNCMMAPMIFILFLFVAVIMPLLLFTQNNYYTLRVFFPSMGKMISHPKDLWEEKSIAIKEWINWPKLHFLILWTKCHHAETWEFWQAMLIFILNLQSPLCSEGVCYKGHYSFNKKKKPLTTSVR